MPDAWRLTYPGVDLSFGDVGSGWVFQSAPEIGTPDIDTEDERRPRMDGVAFGEDYFGGSTISFDLLVGGVDERDTRSRVATLAKAWRADAIRRTPGAVAALHAHTGRVTYGRPRRFAPLDEFTPQGLTQVLADFSATGPEWYSAEEQSVSVSIAPAPGGGLIAPLASPLATTEDSDRSVGFTVDSDLDVWPVVEIEGPITNPIVEVVGLWRMELRTTLLYDHRVTIDARPWARTVLRNGDNLAGAFTRQSVRLTKAQIPPGDYEFVLRGTSATGTARASLRWQSVHPTP